MIIAGNPVSVRRAIHAFKKTYEESGSVWTAAGVAVAIELANITLI